MCLHRKVISDINIIDTAAQVSTPVSWRVRLWGRHQEKDYRKEKRRIRKTAGGEKRGKES